MTAYRKLPNLICPAPNRAPVLDEFQKTPVVRGLPPPAIRIKGPKRGRSPHMRPVPHLVPEGSAAGGKPRAGGMGGLLHQSEEISYLAR